MNNQIRDQALLSVCPNCNAPLPPNGRNEVTCAYCGTVLVRRGPEEDVPHFSRPARRVVLVQPARIARRHKVTAVPRRPRPSRVLGVAGLALLLVAACPILSCAFSGWSAQLASLVRSRGSGQRITVPAQEDWHSTGRRVRPGQTVTIVYLGGTWSVWGGPEQQADGAGHAGEYRDNVPVPGAPAGALIGRIGEGRPFYVGNHLTLTTRQAGILWLGINDQWLNDNTGALRVEVTVASHP